MFPKQPFYVCTSNKVLEQQMKFAGQQFGQIVNYIKHDELSNIESEAIVFIDEHFDGVLNRPLEFDSKGELAGVLGLNKLGQKRFLFCGSTHEQYA